MNVSGNILGGTELCFSQLKACGKNRPLLIYGLSAIVSSAKILCWIRTSKTFQKQQTQRSHWFYIEAWASSSSQTMKIVLKEGKFLESKRIPGWALGLAVRIGWDPNPLSECLAARLIPVSNKCPGWALGTEWWLHDSLSPIGETWLKFSASTCLG